MGNISHRLRVEHLRVLETQPQRPVSQEGVVLLGDVQTVQRLVSADIQGAQDDGALPVGHQDLAVSLELLLFRGQRTAAHVEEL